MTVSTVYQPVTFAGNGVATAVPFPYTFYNNTDLLVQLVLISTGVATTQTLGVDYTVSGGSGAGGTVTFTTAPSALYRGVIQYIPDLLQGTNFVDNDPLFADDVEEALDKNVLANQHISAEVDRALKFPATDPSASRGEIPNSVARANSIFSFDANGVPSVVTLSSLGSINVSLTSPQTDDALVYNAGVWNNKSIGSITAAATTATPVSTDLIPFADVSDSNNTKKSTIATILGLITNVTNAMLSTMAANTVKVNATASSATPTDLALSASQLLGRGSTGNVAAITLGTGLSMSGATLNNSGPFTKSFTQNGITMVSGSNLGPYAHGFGEKPKLILLELICTTAELGYSVGDSVYWSSYTDSANSQGTVVYADTTNIRIRTTTNSSAVDLLNATFGTTGMSYANWSVTLRAWA